MGFTLLIDSLTEGRAFICSYFFSFFVRFIAFSQTGLFIMLRQIHSEPDGGSDPPLGLNTYMMLPVETQRLDRVEAARLVLAGSPRRCASPKNGTPVDIC